MLTYQATKISTPDLDRLLAAVEDKSTIRALCYIVSGIPFWEVSSDDWTWVFNTSTQTWFERQSNGLERSRFTGGSVYAFGKWLVGDTQTAKLLEVASVPHETGNPLQVTIITPSLKDWPNRVRFARADFDIVVPAITTSSTQPTIDISWSDDGGVNYSNPYSRSLGDSTSDNLAPNISRNTAAGCNV